jgi:hypothetical protein
MRRAALLLTTAVAVLSAATAAWAGGYATANLDSTPKGVAPGEPWNVEMTILQHGRTPLPDLSPAIVVALPGGGEKRFAGEPVDGKPGAYRATVVFPKAGNYSYKVDDGFTNAIPHTFPPVQIGGGATAAEPTSDGIAWWPFALAAALVAAVGVSLAGRGRARRAASSSAARRSAPAAAHDPNG